MGVGGGVGSQTLPLSSVTAYGGCQCHNFVWLWVLMHIYIYIYIYIYISIPFMLVVVKVQDIHDQKQQCCCELVSSELKCSASVFLKGRGGGGLL